MSENARRENRIQGIVDRISSENDFDSIKWITQAPVQTFCRSAVDETAQKNAALHNDLGIPAKIERRTTGNETCKWCDNLAGTYDYEDVKGTGNPVFRRHDDCDCIVMYEPGDGTYQDVCTKAVYKTDKDLIEERAALDLKLKPKTTGKRLANKIENTEKAKKTADKLYYVHSAKTIEDLQNILASYGYQLGADTLEWEFARIQKTIIDSIKSGDFDEYFLKLDEVVL